MHTIMEGVEPKNRSAIAVDGMGYRDGAPPLPTAFVEMAYLSDPDALYPADPTADGDDNAGGSSTEQEGTSIATNAPAVTVPAAAEVAPAEAEPEPARVPGEIQVMSYNTATCPQCGVMIMRSSWGQQLTHEGCCKFCMLCMEVLPPDKTDEYAKGE
jgi:predicted RNA-binding Zn-ribbon protein involved in translation (DUF1610 family)